RDTIPKLKRYTFRTLNARTISHSPFAIESIQKYLRVETLGPFDHCCVIMRMRNRNPAEAAARLHLGNRFIVQQRDAIPRQISYGRLQEQSALAYREFRFGAYPLTSSR